MVDGMVGLGTPPPPPPSSQVTAILAENGLTFDTEALDIVFKKFDVDGSGTLNFDEFCEMMSDLKAETAIVEKRSTSYELPANLKQHFTDEQVPGY